MDSMKSFHFIPNAIGNWRRTEPIQRRDSAPTGARIKTRWGGEGDRNDAAGALTTYVSASKRCALTPATPIG